MDSEAYQQSLALLRRCLTPAGFVASPSDIDNYARVWARDGVISGLAALASGESDLVAGMQHTLATLAQAQGPHGEIPSNVTVDGSQVSYGRLSGRVDAPLWYVIGVSAYLRATGDTVSASMHRPVVERALFLAGCWEFNNRGLIYTPVAGNWADEYIQHGYVLSDQLLYLLALRGAGAIFARPDWEAKAEELQHMLAVNYWPHPALVDNPLVYHPHAYRALVERAETVHWLPSFTPGGYATYFDGLAHALALIVNLGDEDLRLRAEHYVQGVQQIIGSDLLPAFWPVIQPGDADWQQLQANHLYGQLKNLPFMYHNGGLWAMLTGLYVVGLVRNGRQQRARSMLSALHEANTQSREQRQWEFAEFHHGQTKQPLGTAYLAWSAAAAVLAQQAVEQGMILWPLSA